MVGNAILANEMDVPPPLLLQRPLIIPKHLLLGPGPSNCPPEIVNACSQAVIGPMDQDFLQVMEEVKSGIKYAFQTTNENTFAISGTGHLAMEAALCNILEPEDILLCIDTGIWSERAFDMGMRLGAKSYALQLPLGEILTLQKLELELNKVKPILLFLCHGDSSAGLLQPLEGIGELCHKHRCLLLVDAVASLGGCPMFMDRLDIDILYTGSQKVLNAPPGISPISFSPKAMIKILSRKTPIKSFYMDAKLIANYWNCDNSTIRYHHTAPITLVYGLREALSILAKETLEKCWERHAKCADMFYDGLKEIGLSCFVLEKLHRLPTVTAVTVPYGIDYWSVIQCLKERFGIEITGGLGRTAGMIWRIGFMGYNATPENVRVCLEAMKTAFNECKTHSNM